MIDQQKHFLYFFDEHAQILFNNLTNSNKLTQFNKTNQNTRTAETIKYLTKQTTNEEL